LPAFPARVENIPAIARNPGVTLGSCRGSLLFRGGHLRSEASGREAGWYNHGITLEESVAIIPTVVMFKISDDLDIINLLLL
jgi:hypothetical protein